MRGSLSCDGDVYVFHFHHEAEEKEIGEGLVYEVGDEEEDHEHMAELREKLAEWREKHSDEIVATVRITRDIRMARRARRLREFGLAEWDESEK